MFRPEDIEKVTLLFPKEDSQKLYHELHEKGVCAVDDANQEVNPELEEIIELGQYAQRLTNRLKVFLPKSKKLVLTKPSPYKRSKAIFTKIGKELAQIDTQSQELLETVSDAEQTIDTVTEQNAILRLLPKDVKTNALAPTKFYNVLVGTIPLDEVKSLKFESALFSHKTISETEALLIVCSQENIASDLFAKGFIKIDFAQSDKTPKELIAEKKKLIAEATQEIKTAKEKLTELSIKEYLTLEIYSEEIDVCVRELTGKAANINYETFTSAVFWVPISQKEHFEKIVQKTSPNAVSFAETDNEKAPTKLKNGLLVKPFELITKLYAVPKSTGFDPTFFIAFTFPIFFGLMLTDFVYGLGMLLVASVLFVKTAKREEGMRAFSALLIISGISTMVFGVIFGSYWGNFFQNLGFNVPAFLDSMKDIIPMIAIVLTLGIIHISIGLIIGFSEAMREKRYFDGFKEQGVWLVFVLAIILLLVGGLTTAVAFTNAGLFTLAVSVLMQFILTLRKDGAINAVLALFDFSGFLGDVFSYIRLMALAIGTSGIALAVNFMVVMANDLIPYVGILFAILIFIVGHLFNLVMNGLGGFIHTLRLHFLEHFSKYYDGGGKEYIPFFANRNKTVTEENK